MIKRLIPFAAVLLLAFGASAASADEYQDTINVFRKAIEGGAYFKTAYGYAVFPTIGKGGVGVGGAYGKGRVYQHGKYVGDTSMTQVTVGFQLGGQAYSQIVFFQNEEAFKKFTSGNFAFGAEASAIATAGTYNDGMATLTVAKGGLMYEASIGGQKFNYKPR